MVTFPLMENIHWFNGKYSNVTNEIQTTDDMPVVRHMDFSFRVYSGSERKQVCSLNLIKTANVIDYTSLSLISYCNLYTQRGALCVFSLCLWRQI